MRAILVVAALALLVVAVPTVWLYGSVASLAFDSRLAVRPTPTEAPWPTPPPSPLPLFPHLSLAELIRIARCPRLTDETGLSDSFVTKEVADAFLLGQPRPGFLDYLEERYGRAESGDPHRRIAHISQSRLGDPPHVAGYQRSVGFGTATTAFQINFLVGPWGQAGIAYVHMNFSALERCPSGSVANFRQVNPDDLPPPELWR